MREQPALERPLAAPRRRRRRSRRSRARRSRSRTPGWWPGSSPVRTSSSLTLRRAAPSSSRSTSSGSCRCGWCVANAQYLQCDTQVRDSDSVTLRENVTRRRIRGGVYGGAAAGSATSRSTSSRAGPGGRAPFGSAASASTRSAKPGRAKTSSRHAPGSSRSPARRGRRPASRAIARHERRAQHAGLVAAAAPAPGRRGSPPSPRAARGRWRRVARYHGSSSRSVASRQAAANAAGSAPCSRSTSRSSAACTRPSAMPRPSRRVRARPGVARRSRPRWPPARPRGSGRVTPPIGSTPVIGSPSSQWACARAGAHAARSRRRACAQALERPVAGGDVDGHRPRAGVGGQRSAIEKLPSGVSIGAAQLGRRGAAEEARVVDEAAVLGLLGGRRDAGGRRAGAACREPRPIASTTRSRADRLARRRCGRRRRAARRRAAGDQLERRRRRGGRSGPAAPAARATTCSAARGPETTKRSSPRRARSAIAGGVRAELALRASAARR